MYRTLRASLDAGAQAACAGWTLARLRPSCWRGRAGNPGRLPGLSSDVIGCVVKLMRDGELTALGRDVHPLPGATSGRGDT